MWLTGLPGAGKTTISDILVKELAKTGMRVEQLDGDEVRKWLSPGEGFSKEDRERHLHREAHVAQLLARNDVVVLCAFVSPYISSRKYARDVISNFVPRSTSTARWRRAEPETRRVCKRGPPRERFPT